MMDIRLYYEKAGDGEPLILLHGNGEDGTYFKHQMEYFSKDYRVIAIDTRGHGKSLRGEKPFTIRQFAEDLNGFMEEQGMERRISWDSATAAISRSLLRSGIREKWKA